MSKSFKPAAPEGFDMFIPMMGVASVVTFA